jgi:hypothetical protein
VSAAHAFRRRLAAPMQSRARYPGTDIVPKRTRVP